MLNQIVTPYVSIAGVHECTVVYRGLPCFMDSATLLSALLTNHGEFPTHHYGVIALCFIKQSWGTPSWGIAQRSVLCAVAQHSVVNAIKEDSSQGTWGTSHGVEAMNAEGPFRFHDQNTGFTASRYIEGIWKDIPHEHRG